MWRRRSGWALLLLGLAALGAGIAWLATVWNDDAARMDAAAPAGGLIIGGILGIVFGAGLLSGGSGGDSSSWDLFDW